MNTTSPAIIETPCPGAGRRFVVEASNSDPATHNTPSRASAAARGGVLWVAVCKGWSCNPERVAAFLAIIERQERQA